jgi:uncharacterized protein YwgA
MSRINNLLGLLRLLKASDGELETRIRVQKEAYLLGLKFPDFFDTKGFEYHHFGPYSRGLSEALQFAVSSDLVHEFDESPSDGSFTKYKYRITDSGIKAVEALGEVDGKIADFAKQLKSYEWRALELASTIRFLEVTEGLKREESLKKALLLKPNTSGHQDAALNIVAQL